LRDASGAQFDFNARNSISTGSRALPLLLSAPPVLLLRRLLLSDEDRRALRRVAGGARLRLRAEGTARRLVSNLVPKTARASRAHAFRVLNACRTEERARRIEENAPQSLRGRYARQEDLARCDAFGPKSSRAMQLSKDARQVFLIHRNGFAGLTGCRAFFPD